MCTPTRAPSPVHVLVVFLLFLASCVFFALCSPTNYIAEQSTADGRKAQQTAVVCWHPVHLPEMPLPRNCQTLFLQMCGLGCVSDWLRRLAVCAKDISKLSRICLIQKLPRDTDFPNERITLDLSGLLQSITVHQRASECSLSKTPGKPSARGKRDGVRQTVPDPTRPGARTTNMFRDLRLKQRPSTDLVQRVSASNCLYYTILY